MVIGLASLKGGVGKTTIAASLASSLASQGKKVLVVDANYSAPNLGLHMDLICPGETIHDVLHGGKISAATYSQYGVDLIPGNFLYNREVNPLKLRSRLNHVRKSYDFVILDSAPSLNDELFSVLYAADELFLISTPDYPTLSCAIKLARITKSRNQKISGIIVNRIVDTNYQLSLSEIQESTGIPVVVLLPEDKSVLRALSQRIPVSLFAARSKFSRELSKLTDSLVGNEEERPFFQRVFSKDLSPVEVNREVLREHFYTSIFSA